MQVYNDDNIHVLCHLTCIYKYKLTDEIPFFAIKRGYMNHDKNNRWIQRQEGSEFYKFKSNFNTYVHL